MDNYLPGEEKISSKQGSISKFCSNEDVFEVKFLFFKDILLRMVPLKRFLKLFVTDESEVEETISLARSVLTEGKMVLIKSVSKFGVHAQVVGQIRKKVTQKLKSTWKLVTNHQLQCFSGFPQKSTKPLSVFGATTKIPLNH